MQQTLPGPHDALVVHAQPVVVQVCDCGLQHWPAVQSESLQQTDCATQAPPQQ